MSVVDKQSRSAKWGLPLLGTTALFVGWYLATEVFHVVPVTTLPSPVQITLEFVEFRELILKNLRSTLLAGLIGFSVTVVLSIVLGILLSINVRLKNALLPLIVGGNSIPRIALAPLIIFYVGGFDAKYLISAWIAFFPMLASTLEGFSEIDDDLEMMLDSLGATTWQKLRYVRFPNALEFIFDGMKLAVILALVGAVVGEFISSDEGVGFLALTALEVFNTTLVFAIVGLVGFISMAAFFSLFILQDRIVYWRDTKIFME